MKLVYTISALCLLIEISRDLVKLLINIILLAVGIFGIGPCAASNITLQLQLKQAKQELENHRENAEPQAEGFKDVNVRRSENRVKQIEAQIKSKCNISPRTIAAVEYISGYVVKIILCMSLAVIGMRNRFEPVFIFEEGVNLGPLEGLFSFPSGVPNAISVTMWTMSCQATIRLCKGRLKKRL